MSMKVGVILPLRDLPHVPAPRYREMRALAQHAEALAFDSLWLFDHLLVRAPGEPDYGFWEAWTMLSALAEATDRVEVGTLVACASFRNPALLANMADALDEVSAGRLVLGLGAGNQPAELQAFGLPRASRIAQLADALAIVRPLLRTGEADYRGPFSSASACVSLPRGPRPSGPPILVGGHGPRLLRLAARFADAWNTCWFASPDDEWQRQRAAVRAACREVGRDPTSLALTVGLPVLYPDLGAVLPEGAARARVLSGGIDEIVAALRAFDSAGVAHLMCSVKPATHTTLERLAAALRVYREGESAAG
jgi:alkanesulfonate monooxygenase SsuD/methylene tetrahydromethanopterin reductase-like flavin-dependent oxidoreductase (luciferase family)